LSSRDGPLLLLVFQEMKQSIFKRHPEMRTRFSRDGGATWEGDGVVKGIWWGCIQVCCFTTKGFLLPNVAWKQNELVLSNKRLEQVECR
jgi:hypothetical protein